MFCCEIISGLWIGDSDIMCSSKFIRENNIEIVINFTIDCVSPVNDIRFIRIPILDDLKNDTDILELNKYLKDILLLIQNNTDKCNILLSCYDGKSVSALVIALYILKNSSITSTSVRRLIQSKSKDIALDYDFSFFIV